MGKINSKNKGDAGERELANILKEYGYDAKRGQQYNGADGSADVLGLPHIHIECKRVERLNIYDAMSQAEHDAREGEIPAVFHRRNHDRWKVTMYLDDFMKIYPEWEASWNKETEKRSKNEEINMAVECFGCLFERKEGCSMGHDPETCEDYDQVDNLTGGMNL